MLPLLAAIIPALFPIVYLTRQLRYRQLRERIWISFGFGFSVAIPVVAVVAVYFSPLESVDDIHLSSFLQAFIGAAIPEEFAKCLIVIYFSFRHGLLSKPVDAVILSASVALGFAAIENIFYVLGAESDWGEMAAIRAFSAVPMHAVFGVVMGYFAALNFERIKHRVWPSTAMLLVPIVMHGIYNYPAILSEFTCSNDLEVTLNPDCAKAIFAIVMIIVLYLGIATVAFRKIASFPAKAT